MGSMASMCSSVEVHSEEPKPEFTDLNMNHMFLGAIYSLPDQRIRRSSSGMDPRSSTISIQSSESTNVKHDNNDGDAESLGKFCASCAVLCNSLL